jgi:hypothetical protein
MHGIQEHSGAVAGGKFFFFLSHWGGVNLLLVGDKTFVILCMPGSMWSVPHMNMDLSTRLESTSSYFRG